MQKELMAKIASEYQISKFRTLKIIDTEFKECQH